MNNSLPELQQARGDWGEECLRHELVALRDRGECEFFCRPEWIVVPSVGVPYFCEAKGQEVFEPPPFRGHGLPPYQADRYQRLRDKLGMRTRFVIYDPSGWRYSAWLDELEARGSDYIYETNGAKPRRIYEVGGFHRKRIDDLKAAA